MGLTGLLCNLIGTVYPAYASFKAIESPGAEDDRQWLTCWFPLYHHIKLLVVMWMIAPQTQGAKKLYEEFVKPFLYTHAGKIDPVFNSTKAVIHLNITNSVARLVEQHGPTAAHTMTNMVFSQDNMARLTQLAQADPKLVERVFKMAVDSVATSNVQAR